MDLWAFHHLSNRSEIDPSAVGYCRCQCRVESSVCFFNQYIYGDCRFIVLDVDDPQGRN